MTAARPHAIGVPGYTSTLPCEPEAVGEARQLVSNALSTWGMGDDLTAAGKLIVSELMTNTIDHTRCRTAKVVVERRREDLVRIGVADKDRSVPDMNKKPSVEDEGGRGLLLVDKLSHQWGYERFPHGKVVWAELLVPEPPKC
jgi:anti-sigma regulatory factor (Ser/Thr protein kinase)